MHRNTFKKRIFSSTAAASTTILCCLLLTACPSRRSIAPIQEGNGNNPVISEINRQVPLNSKIAKPANATNFPNNERVIIAKREPIEVIVPPVMPDENLSVGIIPVVQKINKDANDNKNTIPFPTKVVINKQIAKEITKEASTETTKLVKNNVSKKYYPVKTQDTWYSVSRVHQVSLEQLAQANGITIDDLKDSKYQLKVGQTLAIPLASKTVPITNQKNGTQKYTVQPQDNWYSIARVYKISPVELAKFNQKNVLSDFDLLKIGQTISIPTLQNSDVNKEKNTKIIPDASNTPQSLAPQSLAPQFSFPLEGKKASLKNILKNFSQTNNKGVDFVTEKHQVVISVAAGKVIYASNQLKDYGNMLMIEHRNDWVSVYAFLDKLLIKEGAITTQNQAIGLTDNKKMHFELRQSEKPMNPLVYFPK